MCVCDKEVSSFVPVLKEHDFKDDPLIFYQFVEHRRRAATVKPSSSASLQEGVATKRVRSASSTDRSSVSSLLDDCFDTIAHLGPEAMLYAVLAKRWVPNGCSFWSVPVLRCYLICFRCGE